MFRIDSNPSDLPQDKLAVLLPGLGAVATTFIAGTDAVRRGLHVPVGSLTQMGHLPPTHTHDAAERIRDVVPLAALTELVFGGWDIYEGTAYDAALKAGVLTAADMEDAREILTSIRPMRAVFDSEYIRNISGPNVKHMSNKMDQAQALIKDILGFIEAQDCARGVGVWCASTERYTEIQEVHLSIDSFEQGLCDSHPAISPSMIYAYAFIKAGVPLANGAPNLALDVPAIKKLAIREGVAIAGKDFKTGQTLMKTILAPGFCARMLGVHGWYSTNILGNTDGAVLDDPGSFKTKEESKLSVLDSILDSDAYPDLYEDMEHKVRIDYYKPRGDNKEGWDNIDIFGWMGYSMQIKINFLCRDSILAAPLVLDLALLMDLAQRAGKYGVQDWLSFYFKAPQPVEGEVPTHNLFEQLEHVYTTLRTLASHTFVTPIPAE